MSMKKIPAGLEELSGVKAWLCYAESYDSSKHHGTGGYSKLPFSALSLRSVGWEHNLSDFATAAGRIGQAIPGAKVKTKPRRDSPSQIVPAVVSGIGFYLPKSGYICIDLDEVYNGTYGTLTEEASQIVRICGSYTEISPSWRGLHIIVRAEGAPDFSVWDTSQAKGKPDTRGGTAGEYQILPGYMTVTGQAHIRSQPLRALTPEEWAQLSAFFTRPAKPEPVTSPAAGASSVTSSGQAPATPQGLRAQAQPQAVSGDGSLTQSERLTRWQELLPALSDDDLLTRIFKANHKAEDLFTNTWSGYGYESSSEADAALLALFLSYTQNTETAKRLFRQSQLYQGDKDPKQRGDAYINLTLKSVEGNGITPLAGFIDFTRDDRRNYAIGHEAPEAPLDWGDSISAETPAEAPSVTSSGQPQPSAQAQAGAPQGSVLRQVQATAQALTTKPAFDWEKYAGAHFDPDEDNIPEGYPIPTGIPNFDEALAGGIYPALYVIGAISSLGKTSLVVQLADTVARSGRPVLYFSLEMSRRELRAKSLSRLMFTGAANSRQAQSWSAYTATEILFPSTRHKDNNPTAENLTARLEAAKKDYSEHEGHNVYYLTGIGTIKAAKIAELTRAFMLAHPDRLKPLVIVDYLQILAAEDPHDTDKTRTDKAVVALKRLSAKEKIPVIAVSSFNRENYTSPVSEAAFKESGAVEYSADVLIGLQPNGMKPALTKENIYYNMCCCAECKSDPISRHLEAKVLKSRVGVPGKAAKLEYRPGYNIFRDESPDYKYKPKDTEILNWETGQGTGSGQKGKGRKGKSRKDQAMDFDSTISREPKDGGAELGSDDNPF
jgi:replicative DNA helicase